MLCLRSTYRGQQSKGQKKTEARSCSPYSSQVLRDFHLFSTLSSNISFSYDHCKQLQRTHTGAWISLLTCCLKSILHSGFGTTQENTAYMYSIKIVRAVLKCGPTLNINTQFYLPPSLNKSKLENEAIHEKPRSVFSPFDSFCMQTKCCILVESHASLKYCVHQL